MSVHGHEEREQQRHGPSPQPPIARAGGGSVADRTDPVARPGGVATIAAVAERYVAERFGDRAPADGLDVVIDEAFCTEVAARFNEAVSCFTDAETQRCYTAMKRETLHQFEALTAGGVVVRPWLAGGQPYRSSGELRARVDETSMIYVYLTRCGHGPCAEVDENHPMCELSPVVIEGEPLLYNDLFRAVHDAFGHVMRGNDFGVAGEFLATHEHLRMYSDEARPAVFAETVGQISWFYFGPHLRSQDRLLRPGEPGYLPPARRPYPQQKVFLFPDELLARYHALFSERTAS